MSIVIRDVREHELDSVLALNNNAGLAILPLDSAKVRRFYETAEYFRVAERDGNLAGFLVGFGSGAGHDSSNFAWFGERYPHQLSAGQKQREEAAVLGWLKGQGAKGQSALDAHAKLLDLKITPTTVLVVPPNNYYVVSQGMMAESQLADRIVLAADSANLLPEPIATKVRSYDRGVLKPDDTKQGASSDPAQWVKYLKDRLQGRY